MWRYILFLIFVTFEGRLSNGADSVAESSWFGLNLDGRVSIVDTAPVEYVVWLTEFFTTEDLFNLALVAEDSDPDGDGDANRFEFFANLDPTDTGDRLRFLFGGEENRTLTISPFKQGVDFTIQVSADLENWLTLDSDLYEQSGESIEIDLGELPKKAFYRLELQEPEPSL